MGEHVDAAVDGNAQAGQIRGVGEDEFSVEVALVGRSPGDGDGHGKDLAALDPGAGEELGDVGAGIDIAADDAAGSIRSVGLRQQDEEPGGKVLFEVEGMPLGG